MALPFSDAAFKEAGAGSRNYNGGAMALHPAGSDGPSHTALDEGLFMSAAAGPGGGALGGASWAGAAAAAPTFRSPFADELDWTLPIRQSQYHRHPVTPSPAPGGRYITSPLVQVKQKEGTNAFPSFRICRDLSSNHSAKD